MSNARPAGVVVDTMVISWLFGDRPHDPLAVGVTRELDVIARLDLQGVTHLGGRVTCLPLRSWTRRTTSLAP